MRKRSPASTISKWKWDREGGKVCLRYFAPEQEPKYKGGIKIFKNSRKILESKDSWEEKKEKKEKIKEQLNSLSFIFVSSH